MTSDFPSDAERSDETRDTGDNAFARLEKEMANMRDAIGGLSDQISDAASDLGSAAQEQARRGMKHARANMGSMVNDASDRLGGVAHRAQTQGFFLCDPRRDRCGVISYRAVLSAGVFGSLRRSQVAQG